MIKYTEEEIVKYSNYSVKELVDGGICPTCFNKCSGGKVYGSNENLLTYEDEEIECLFVPNPRAEGHMMIAPKKHYHDMSEASDEINEKIISFSKAYMNILKEVFECERVYFCSMSDGPMNHYHIQLIPRYSYEERGSLNFVKQRKNYEFDEQKFERVKSLIAGYALKEENGKNS